MAVYLSKVDPERMAPRKAENPDQKELGHSLEPVILNMLGARKNLNLFETGTIRSTKHEWALATPDRLVVTNDPNASAVPVGTSGLFDAVAEAKNVGLRMIGDWREERGADEYYGDDEEFAVPDYVHVQVAWQMLVTGTRRGFVAALLGGRDFRAFDIYADPRLEDTLLNVCGDFWHQHVIKRVPPAPGTNERAAKAIEAMFPRASEAVIEAPGIAETWADQYIDAKAQEKYYGELRLQAENNLKILTGTNGGMVSRQWRLSWKNTASAGVDWKAVAAALAAPDGIPQGLIKAHTRPGYRRFLLTPSKERKIQAVMTGTSAPPPELEDVTT